LSGQVAVVAVYRSFEIPPSSAALASLEREVSSILEPLGLEVVWRSIDSPERTVVSQRLIVANFTGRCDARGLPTTNFRSGQLGRTHITDGKILPFVDVHCDHIRGYVRAPLMASDAQEREEMLGRAMGRVFAHELYHVLGQTSHHGSGTVDHQAYTVHELVEPTLSASGDCRLLEVQGATPGSRASRRRGKLKFAEKLCNVCHGSSGEGTKRAPPLRSPGRTVDAALLAVRLGIDGPTMCRNADRLKLDHPLLGKQDIDDLVRYLNAPPF